MVQPRDRSPFSKTALKRLTFDFKRALPKYFAACTSFSTLHSRIAAKPNPCVFLSAGEASGDLYGAQIITELCRRHPGASFVGLGGPKMAAAGQRRLVRAEDVAHMGITEVLRHMPYIYMQYRKLVGALKGSRPHARPDVAVLIDFPDVNFRLARHCRRLGIPVLWFVSPQLWAWKRRRLRWVQKRVARMMVIFPFEEDFYRNRKVQATFVGHPLAALPPPAVSREQYARHYRLDPGKPWIALLPGSRHKEIEANIDALLETIMRRDRRQWSEYIIPVASTADQPWLERHITRWLRAHERDFKMSPQITLVDDARDALHHARASIVASGTATVQALIAGNPFVVVYRVSRLTFAVAKRLVRYPGEIAAQRDAAGNLPIAMPNLIAGRRIVPEFLNDRFNARQLAAALRSIAEDGPRRTQMISDLAEARARLVAPNPGASLHDGSADGVGTSGAFADPAGVR